ncbi:hypothetical protein M011DRAFT_455695 [Sporormia fimetaria CBS 119925]|uniref:Uncharacterized protein n=1 Tax=Sporormia fimetaria CBS 119925 TaxID=1340428 RepID=A0A6A6VN88_9PLEO|nr:hypothetical protein M011DRAFT_455695 [Sporormia fimetaria CBS 119925]
MADSTTEQTASPSQSTTDQTQIDDLATIVDIPASKISRVGMREYGTAHGKTYWRYSGTKSWNEHDLETPDPESSAATPTWLSVVLKRQPPPLGHHWLLFIAKEEQPGTVLQVLGDHTFMTYSHMKDVDVVNDDDFASIYQIAQIPDRATVEMIEQCAASEPPPRAETQAEVRDTCQSWAIRVVARLVEEGVVQDASWPARLGTYIDSRVLLEHRCTAPGKHAFIAIGPRR